ncbi:MAG: helix-turn-helix transcriptional regulator [Gammaproteobacteria bacterium]|nr:helix-turn-helix transcriptional regulator [Gammaproteobacteria bacterium]
MQRRSSFGTLLRYWRKARGMTQFDVSMTAGYSQRHVSFLESGRSQPSRETVMVLAETLNVPVRERNVLLDSAGFAPVYTQEPLTSEHLEVVLGLVHDVLASHRPFPALLVDRSWNTFALNQTANVLFSQFVAGGDAYESLDAVNAVRICLDDAGLKPFIRNWHGFMRGILGQLKSELQREVVHEDIAALIDDIQTALARSKSEQEASLGDDFPVVRLQLERDGMQISLFTMMSSFNLPLDATIAELRIETFLPADDASRAFLLALDRTSEGVREQA